MLRFKQVSSLLTMSSDNIPEFGKVLRKIRARKQLRYYNIAEAIDVPSYKVCSIELGAEPLPLDFFDKLLASSLITREEKEQLELAALYQEVKDDEKDD